MNAGLRKIASLFCGRTKVCYVHGRHRPGNGGGAETVRIDILYENQMERSRAAAYSYKEPETLEWIRRHTEPDDIFWDIGANIGLYSLYAAKLGCKVFAFEPHLPNAAKLLRNVRANGLEHAIKTVPICLLEGERFGGFFVSSFEPGSSIHKFSDEQSGGTSSIRFPGHTTPVEYGHHVFCTTGDRLVREWSFPEPHHVKIDVDGRDQDVLEGMKGLLQAACEEAGDFGPFPYAGKLRSVLMEVHENDLERTASFMRLFGFHEETDYPETSKEREKRRATEEGGKWAGHGNAIFVRR